jgi:hypothetical protein
MKVLSLMTAAASGALVLAACASAQAEPKSVGTLAFSPEGVLFIADGAGAAIYAYPTKTHLSAVVDPPLRVEHIDAAVATALHVRPDQVEIDGMAVQPVSRDVFLSANIRSGDHRVPAVVSVSADGKVSRFDLNAAGQTRYAIQDAPSAEQHFRSRVGEVMATPSAAAYADKAKAPMSTMTVVDMKFHDGELFVSGVSNAAFSSTLRRIPYPFNGQGAESQVQIYHIAHGQYETRAPIRAMQFATIDGQDTLVAAYACSPLVLIPVADIKPGAKIMGKTIGDMGNGQPISMVPFKYDGKDALFVTNFARGPYMIPLSGLQNAKRYDATNSLGPQLLDDNPNMPVGPVGKTMMFVGSSLRADLLNDQFFVSLTREPGSGSLTLEALPTWPLPASVDKIWVEMDFPGGKRLPQTTPY